MRNALEPVDARRRRSGGWRLPLGAALALLVVWTLGCSIGRGTGPKNRDVEVGPPPELRLLGVFEVASGTRFENTTIGGLSAIAFDAQNGTYLALSDDRGDRGEPPRFYTLDLRLSDGGKPDGVTFLSMVALDREGGFSPGSIDPEGLALRGHDVWISSEGVAADGIAPFVRRFGRDGAERGELALPSGFSPGEGRGVRDNKGLESLTVSPDGARLFVANEEALKQDGPAADLDRSSWVRILVYELNGEAGDPGALVGTYVYRVDPVAVRPTEPDGFRTNGLVELLALDRTHLLALERAWAAGGGHALRLYEIDLTAADDASQVVSLERLAPGGPPAPLAKRLVLDLGATLTAAGVPLDNLEGLTLGPELADGRQTVIVVGDDNFNPDEQRTLFVVLGR